MAEPMGVAEKVGVLVRREVVADGGGAARSGHHPSWGLRNANLDQNRTSRRTADDGPPPAAVSAQVRHLTETDLARRWRMSVRTLQAWRWRKIGPPYVKAVGKVLYRLCDIEAFEVEHLQGPQS